MIRITRDTHRRPRGAFRAADRSIPVPAPHSVSTDRVVAVVPLTATWPVATGDPENERLYPPVYMQRWHTWFVASRLANSLDSSLSTGERLQVGLAELNWIIALKIKIKSSLISSGLEVSVASECWNGAVWLGKGGRRVEERAMDSAGRQAAA